MMKFYKTLHPNAKTLGKAIAIYSGPGPVDAVRQTASLGGIQNPWINKVWTEFMDSISSASIPANTQLAFSIGNIDEIERDKTYHIHVQFFTL